MSTTTLSLPEPFDTARVCAHMEYGRRLVTLTLEHPGALWRNRYHRAWVDVHEETPWRGEPLWVTAYRYPAERDWSRVPFTATGRAHVAETLLPPIARYGFNRLWTELHRTDDATVQRVVRQAAEAQRAAEWWQLRAELTELHRAGLIDLVPIPPKGGGARTPMEPMIGGDGRFCRVEVQARAVGPDGERLGFVTRGGELIPHGDLIHPHNALHSS